MSTTAQYGTAIYGDSLYGAITLDCATGSYSLTGGNASFLLGRAITALSGSYTLTGENAVPIKTSVLNAGGGTYDITGVSAGGIYDQVVFAGNGAYTLTGSDANLVYSQVLDCTPGSYTLTGSDAEFIYTQPDQQVRGGIGKKKRTVIKKSQSEEIESIIRKAFNKLEGIDDDIVEEVKSEVKQDIKQIDLTNYDLALSQVRLLVLMAESRIKMLEEIRAEDEDEAALLMLI